MTGIAGRRNQDGSISTLACRPRTAMSCSEYTPIDVSPVSAAIWLCTTSSDTDISPGTAAPVAVAFSTSIPRSRANAFIDSTAPAFICARAITSAVMRVACGAPFSAFPSIPRFVMPSAAFTSPFACA